MDKLRQQGARLRRKLTTAGAQQPAVAADGGNEGLERAQLRRLRQRVNALEEKLARERPDDRIEQLELEIQELRALGARVAELADLVTEVLAVSAGRDPEIQQRLAKYLDGV